MNFDIDEALKKEDKTLEGLISAFAGLPENPIIMSPAYIKSLGMRQGPDFGNYPDYLFFSYKDYRLMVLKQPILSFRTSEVKYICKTFYKAR